MNRQTRLVYAVLAAVWLAILAWQLVEHSRVKLAAKAELRNRAKDISNTVGLVLGSQRHVITKERLESALRSLIKPQELTAVAMLNAAGDIVASAGAPIDTQIKRLLPTGEHWERREFALMNLVALGTNLTSEAETVRPTIVLPRNELFPNRSGTNRPPFSGSGRPDPPDRPVGPPAEDDVLRPAGAGEDPSSAPPSWSPNRPGPRGDRERGDRDGRPPFRRPFWMSEEDYKSVTDKKGVHSFVIVMSTEPMRATVDRDLWLRLLISALASISVVGFALAWSNLIKSGELELRLVRAAELNARLREMNLAAAGLAHETKNPLNIIRGMAQLISKQEDASPEIRKKTHDIIDEADRVTAQVNEFINFSRPRQLKPAPVALTGAVAELARALGPDLEEKAVRMEVQPDLPVIEADEQQLRQALFNLLINAIQSIHPGGVIQVTGAKRSSTTAVLEVRDNGPGVPPEHRSDVFKPYFTTHQTGTGLGLAVVQQIVLAHGWEIECLPNEPRGAVFRLSHLRLAPGV
jgi:signal transduction histidine kinase